MRSLGFETGLDTLDGCPQQDGGGTKFAAKKAVSAARSSEEIPVRARRWIPNSDPGLWVLSLVKWKRHPFRNEGYLAGATPAAPQQS